MTNPHSYDIIETIKTSNPFIIKITISYANKNSKIIGFIDMKDKKPVNIWRAWLPNGNKVYNINFCNNPRIPEIIVWNEIGEICQNKIIDKKLHPKNITHLQFK